jgi:hypothetical protein
MCAIGKASSHSMTKEGMRRCWARGRAAAHQGSAGLFVEGCGYGHRMTLCGDFNDKDCVKIHR